VRYVLTVRRLRFAVVLVSPSSSGAEGRPTALRLHFLPLRRYDVSRSSSVLSKLMSDGERSDADASPIGSKPLEQRKQQHLPSLLSNSQAFIANTFLSFILITVPQDRTNFSLLAVIIMLQSVNTFILNEYDDDIFWRSDSHITHTVTRVAAVLGEIQSRPSF